MIHAIHNILFPDCLYCLSDECLVAVLPQPCQFLRAQCLEGSFYFRKCKLDWVILRRVSHVEDVPESEPPHLVDALLALVGRQVIHKQTDLVIRVARSQFS